jgi:tRNA nucleotidyltransferase (CCA-adding enzyme)
MVPPSIHLLDRIFATEGHEIRIVGGWVRDHLLGIPPKDLDLATTARPEEMIDLCNKAGLSYSDSGLKHGTLGIIIDHVMYEVTCLRVDVETDGRHAQVEFIRDWQQDASRRDFTINAMSMNLDGTLYDYFDGKTHLVQNRVVFVGDPDLRIKEDYLRILRYFRFSGRMSDLTPRYRDVIAANAAGLQNISGERIWLEMSKILSGNHIDNILMRMFDANVMSHIRLKNIWDTSIQCAQFIRRYTNNPITVLAALTSDESIADTWKLSRDEKNLLHFLQSHIEYSSLKDLKHIATTVGRDYAIELAALTANPSDIDWIRTWNVPKFPVMGRDLIGMGVSPGPSVGELLDRLEQRWRDGDYQMTREELLHLVP